jgi:hypothetical protein
LDDSAGWAAAQKIGPRNNQKSLDHELQKQWKNGCGQPDHYTGRDSRER